MLRKSGLPTLPVENDIFLEKFAELIIEECANIVDSADDSHPHPSFGIKIKDHFGVK